MKGKMLTTQMQFSWMEEEFEALWKKAKGKVGYEREDKKAPWTLKEKKDLVREYIRMLVKSAGASVVKGTS